MWSFAGSVGGVHGLMDKTCSQSVLNTLLAPSLLRYSSLKLVFRFLHECASEQDRTLTSDDGWVHPAGCAVPAETVGKTPRNPGWACVVDTG